MLFRPELQRVLLRLSNLANIDNPEMYRYDLLQLIVPHITTCKHIQTPEPDYLRLVLLESPSTFEVLPWRINEKGRMRGEGVYIAVPQLLHCEVWMLWEEIVLLLRYWMHIRIPLKLWEWMIESPAV
jgi:hypothetical protein